MSQSQQAQGLVQSIIDEGSLSKVSARVLAIPDLGAKIQAGLGLAVDNVKATEPFLVTVLVDDSGSIRFAKNAQAVREGHNTILTALGDSKQSGSILMHTRYLNGTVLYPYSLLDQVVKMDSSNYDPNGGTPLYDETVAILGTVMAKAKEFEDANVPVHTATLIFTDGADEHSHRFTTSDVRSLVTDMLKKETHIIAAMGVDNSYMNFKTVFSEMGIRDEWILTPGNTPSEIRKAFGTFSKSAVRASQSARSFSKTALGGFGA